MKTQPKGRTVLVTGASAGIYRATAKALALEGMRVAVVARRRELLMKLSHEVTAIGRTRLEVIPADVMQPDARASIARQAREKLGQIDILVNCAGGSRFLPIDGPEEIWSRA